MINAETELPLSGLRVVEVGPALAAAFAGQVIAQLGADVIKAEPVGGDPSRRRGPFASIFPSLETSALFLFANLGKRSIGFDRGRPTGTDILDGLLARADIVLWGDDPAAGRAAFDRNEKRAGSVWALVSPFGALGPHAGRRAYGINLFHVGGEGYIMPGGATFARYPDREPLKGPRQMAEFSAGWSVVSAVLAGRYAQVGSPALLLDVSEQEALLRLSAIEAMEFADQGFRVDRAANTMRVGGLVRASDGWLELMPNEQTMWDALVHFMGNPEWASAFTELRTRQAANAEILERISEWSVKKSKVELYIEGQARGIPFGPISSLQEVLESPQLAYRNFFRQIDHAQAGLLSYPMLPWHSGWEAAELGPAPLLGQHNGEILAELGFDDEEVEVMFECGII